MIWWDYLIGALLGRSPSPAGHGLSRLASLHGAQAPSPDSRVGATPILGLRALPLPLQTVACAANAQSARPVILCRVIAHGVSVPGEATIVRGIDPQSPTNLPEALRKRPEPTAHQQHGASLRRHSVLVQGVQPGAVGRYAGGHVRPVGISCHGAERLGAPSPFADDRYRSIHLLSSDPPGGPASEHLGPQRSRLG
jgi:hypothetical protein